MKLIVELVIDQARITKEFNVRHGRGRSLNITVEGQEHHCGATDTMTVTIPIKIERTPTATIKTLKG